MYINIKNAWLIYINGMIFSVFDDIEQRKL